MYVTCDENCVKLTGQNSSKCRELMSSQEEADTRLLLHASHAAQNYDTLIIASEDTDVLVIALGVQQTIQCKLYLQRAMQNTIRFFHIEEIASSLGAEICSSLIGMHSFTGCDSVSAFAGRGKISSLKILMKDKNMQTAMQTIGKHWTMSPDLFTLLQEFVWKMNAARLQIQKVKEL